MKSETKEIADQLNINDTENIMRPKKIKNINKAREDLKNFNLKQGTFEINPENIKKEIESVKKQIKSKKFQILNDKITEEFDTKIRKQLKKY